MNFGASQLFDFIAGVVSANAATSLNYLPDKSKEKHVRVNVKQPVRPFVGREKVLQDLQEKLLFGNDNICVLSGLGGVGKTETVCEFVSRNDATFKHVVWIDAQNVTNIAEGFLEAAESSLSVPTTRYNKTLRPYLEIVIDVYEALRAANEFCLVVFDGSEGLDNSNLGYDGIRRFMPSDIFDNPYALLKILITSSNKDWVNLPSGCHMTLEPLNSQESVELLQFHLPSLKTISVEFIESCGGLPLALEEATVALGSTNKSLVSVDPESFWHELVSDWLVNVSDGNSPSDGINTVWDLALCRIQAQPHGPTATKVLKILSFFPTNSVPKNVLIELVRPLSETGLNSALKLLEQYFFVTLEHERVITSRILQLILRHRQIDPEVTTILNFMKSLMHSLQTQKIQMEEVVEQLLLDVSRKLATNYYSVSGKYIVNFVGLVASKFHALEKLESAMECYRIVDEVLRTRKEELTPEQENREFSLTLRYSIATILEYEENEDEAWKLHKEILEERQRILGSTHIQTLQSMSSVAGILSSKGKYHEALELSTIILAYRTDILGTKHPETLAAQSCVASILRSLGKYNEAVSLLQEVVNAQGELYGPGDPRTLATLHNFGNALRYAGNLERALIVLQKVELKRMSSLGEIHPHTLSTISSIGAILKEQGKLPGALKRFKKVAAGREQIYGASHPKTLKAQNNVASVLRQRELDGDLEEALKIQQHVSSTLEETLGPTHPHSLSAANNVANIVLSLHRLEEALVLHSYVAEKRSAILGADHPDTLTSDFHKAVVCQAQGEAVQAWDLLQQVEEAQVRILGPDHPDSIRTKKYIELIVQSMIPIGDDLALRDTMKNPDYSEETFPLQMNEIQTENIGNLEEALANQRLALVRFEETLGADNRITLTTRYNIAKILEKQQRYDDALLELQQVYDGRFRTLGPHHQDAISTMFEIASVQKQLNKTEDSIQLHKRVLEKRVEFLGQMHLDTCSSMTTLAKMYEQDGKFREALHLHQQVVPVLTKILGPEHASTQASIQSVKELSGKVVTLDAAADTARESEIKLQRLVQPQVRAKWSTSIKASLSLRSQGKIREACNTYHAVVREKEQVLGHDHDDFLRCQTTLVALQLESGDVQNAFVLANKLAKKLSEIHGSDHPKTLSAQTNLALVLSEQNRLSESAAILRSVVDQYKILEGENSLKSLAALANLAIVLRKQGKIDEALGISQDVAKKRESLLGNDHPDTLASWNNTANLLRQKKQFLTALKMHTEVAERRSKLGENHPDYLSSRSNVANLRGDLGYLAEALVMHNDVFEKRSSVLGGLHPDTLASRFNIGVILKKMGNNLEAFEVFQDLAKQRAQVIGLNHPDTVMCEVLANTLLQEQLNV